MAMALGMQYRVESWRARHVNSGDRPVRRVGWPKTSPLVTVATMTSLCSSASVPSRTT